MRLKPLQQNAHAEINPEGQQAEIKHTPLSKGLRRHYTAPPSDPRSLVHKVSAIDPKMFDGRYVLIEGIFDAERKGHKSAFSGSIRNIRRFQLWQR